MKHASLSTTTNCFPAFIREQQVKSYDRKQVKFTRLPSIVILFIRCSAKGLTTKDEVNKMVFP